MLFKHDLWGCMLDLRRSWNFFLLKFIKVSKPLDFFNKKFLLDSEKCFVLPSVLEKVIVYLPSTFHQLLRGCKNPQGRGSHHAQTRMTKGRKSYQFLRNFFWTHVDFSRSHLMHASLTFPNCPQTKISREWDKLMRAPTHIKISSQNSLNLLPISVDSRKTSTITKQVHVEMLKLNIYFRYKSICEKRI